LQSLLWRFVGLFWTFFFSLFVYFFLDRSFAEPSVALYRSLVIVGLSSYNRSLLHIFFSLFVYFF
jgi:hypothetical protein